MKVLSQNGLIGQTGSVVLQRSAVIKSDPEAKTRSVLDYADEFQAKYIQNEDPLAKNWQIERTLTSNTYISTRALTRLKQGYGNNSQMLFISSPSTTFKRNGLSITFEDIKTKGYESIHNQLIEAKVPEREFREFLEKLLSPNGMIDQDLHLINTKLRGFTEKQVELREQIKQEPDNAKLLEELSFVDSQINLFQEEKRAIFDAIQNWNEEMPTKLLDYPGIALEKVQDVFNAWLSRNGFGDTTAHGIVGKTTAVGDGIKTGMMIGNVINTARVGVGAYQGLSPSMKKSVTYLTRAFSADMPAAQRYAIIKKVEKAGDIANTGLGWVDNLFSTPIINMADKIRPGLRKEILEAATHKAQKIAGPAGAGTVGKTLGRTSLGTALAAYSVGYYGATGLRLNYIDDRIDGEKYKIRPSDASRNASLVAGALNVAAISVADIGATNNHTLGTTVTLAAVGSELVAEYFIYQDKKMMEDIHHLIFKADDGPTLRKGLDTIKKKYGTLSEIAPVLGMTGDKQPLRVLLEDKIKTLVNDGTYTPQEAQQVLSEIFTKDE